MPTFKELALAQMRSFDEIGKPGPRPPPFLPSYSGKLQADLDLLMSKIQEIRSELHQYRSEIRQFSQRFDALERRAVNWEKEQKTAGVERRKGNANGELILKRLTSLERATRAIPDEMHPQKFTRKGHPAVAR